jgi:gamma-glutamyltranspeptidase/glutathione hydrolase
MELNIEELLEPSYLKERALLINMDRAGFPETGIPEEKGTVYLSSADSNGMMVSYIQSNYHGFGSGFVVPGTGISLHNRGLGFALEEGHPNQVAGGKRPFHTIIPGFVTKNSKPVMSFGVMGAHMQAQGHVQMVTRIFDYQQNPQTASDAPRWHVMPDLGLALEDGFAGPVIEELSRRGHAIVSDEPEKVFGGAQLIGKSGDFYIAGSDHRKDGQAVGF